MTGTFGIRETDDGDGLHGMRSVRILWLAGALAVLPARALDITVVGLFSGKAVVTVNRGAPRTLSVGEQTPEGVRLVMADSRQAVLEVEGKRLTLEMGQHFETPEQTGSRNTVTLAPDSRGHFVVDGQVNGAPMRFLVDTGATFVSLPAAEAARLGVDLRGARRGVSQTANGPVTVYRTTLESVSIGGVTLYNVEAAIHESRGLDIALLGMSFLNRTEMRRDGGSLTLVKRF
jgi:aspartyl protease family protein